MAHTQIVHVVLNKPLRGHFDYLVTGTPPPVGSRVTVPFGSQQQVGLVVGHQAHSEYRRDKLKTIAQTLDPEPLLRPRDLDFIRWAAHYYHHGLGEAVFHALPKNLRDGRDSASFQDEPRWQLSQQGREQLHKEELRKRAPRQYSNLLKLQDGERLPSSQLKPLREKGWLSPCPAPDYALAEPHLALSAEQQLALNRLPTEGFHPHLLQGVTGSGKTEIYLQWADKILQQDRQILVLVPEIGLTPQTLKRFEARFRGPIGCLHSAMAAGERSQHWLQCQQGQRRILIGTRSAIFTPMPDLGAIIIDEEHDPSYKQQDGFRYSARDLALLRAQRHNIPVLLGSATPSAESLKAVSENKLTLLTLQQRPGSAMMPDIRLVDRKEHSATQGITEPLLEALSHTLEQGQQALLFINRRGYAPTLKCSACGWLASCSHCSVSLTQHRQPPRLHCHHCDSRYPLPHHCPHCRSPRLEALGEGTERLEEYLRRRFAQTPIYRVDRDNTSRKDAMARLYQELGKGEPCILLGTQMLAKGHHFPLVTLAGIIDVDGGLFAGDFRAAERMGQLITQVRGRAGRGQQPGTVILQTHYPDHPLIQELAYGSYDSFANQILASRTAALLPPFSHLALVRCNAPQGEHAEHCLQQLLRYLSPTEPCKVLGPWPSLMEKRHGRYRFELQIKSPQRQALHQLLGRCEAFFATHKLPRTLRWHIDVDPQDMS